MLVFGRDLPLKFFDHGHLQPHLQCLQYFPRQSLSVLTNYEFFVRVQPAKSSHQSCCKWDSIDVHWLESSRSNCPRQGIHSVKCYGKLRTGLILPDQFHQHCYFAKSVAGCWHDPARYSHDIHSSARLQSFDRCYARIGHKLDWFGRNPAFTGPCRYRVYPSFSCHRSSCYHT